MLQITVGTIGKSLFASALRIEFDQVAGDILDSLLCLLLQPVPGTCSQGREAWRFTGIAPSVFTDLIKRVDAHVHLVIVLIHDADHLLIAVAGRHTHQSAELSDTIIHMHDEVAIIHLLQLLHGERHLSGSCRVGTEVVFMESVEDLVIGKEAGMLLMVHESLVDGFLYRGKPDLIPFQLLTIEDILQSFLLLLAVCQYI